MAWSKYNGKKEPRKAEKPRYEVLGVEVDKATFERLNAQSWTIGGVESDLRRVNLYAHSAEIAEHLPAEAAEAKQHYNAIMREIAQNMGGIVQTMKHNNFNGYFAELSNIYNATVLTYKQLANAWNERRKEWETLEPTLRGDANRYALEKARLLLDEDTFKRGIEDIQTKHREQVAALRVELEKARAEFFRNKAEAVDPNVMTLINSSILSVEDCAEMVKGNRANPTMQRLIAGYLDKLAQDTKNREVKSAARNLAYQINEVGRGEYLTESFDAISNTMESSFHVKGRTAAESAATNFFRLDGFSAAIGDTLTDMDNRINNAICGPNVAIKEQ